ncbi:hypothetical protein Ana3638_24555 [Anaerocolumna sedimenticola]|uniref:Uncharacterized protein n=1 Tax=Anaerocolumna sedimenticola TaxID=2696063 RepID=A0A6P1TQM0_9FIRM|nr:hypothetical protein [Anaerocolumna sedimenticola]QHQ63560.1 hypothetical protein Ana3638_24555 [Anaerocolumna sedimenticola]
MKKATVRAVLFLLVWRWITPGVLVRRYGVLSTMEVYCGIWIPGND